MTSLLLSVSLMSVGMGDVRVASLEAAYGKLKRTIVTKNVTAMMKMCASSFTWTNPDGTVLSRAEFTARTRKEFGSPVRFEKLSMKNDSYDFMGKQARVRSFAEVVVSFRNGGETMRMLAKSASVDTWEQTPKGWILMKVEVVSETSQPL